MRQLTVVCLALHIHQPGLEVNVFKGRSSLLLLQLSSNLGKKTLIDEDSSAIFMFFY